jgi:hypothetical protein
VKHVKCTKTAWHERTPKPDDQCLALERTFTGMSSAEMGRLFGLAQDRYESAMPCIGAAAELRGDHPGSVCGVMPNP